MEISLKGQTYRLARLNVFEQLKVARKLLPVLAELIGEIKTVGAGGAAVTQALPKIADAISALPDDDINAILHPCLSVVARKHNNGWATVFCQGELMFDDIDLITLLTLVARVVADSLGNFLRDLPGNETLTPPAA